jgi:hypothetical protein
MLVYNELKVFFFHEFLSVILWETLGITGFEILTAVTIKIIVLWLIMLCNMTKTY